MTAARGPRSALTCTIDGCEGEHEARGWCAKHYQRWKKRRSTDDPRATVEERFWSKVNSSAPGGCWLWTPEPNEQGYGQFSVYGTVRLAHSVAYELLVGPVPAGRQLDHLCHNADESCPGGSTCPHRRCVKVIADESGQAHVQPATQRENTLRGRSPIAVVARATQCPQGHLYDEANTYRRRGGHRDCRACNRERARKRKAKSTTNQQEGNEQT
jgi:hypothetical protein